MNASQSGSRKRRKTGQHSNPSSTSCQKSSAYDPVFQQELKDNGVFIDDVAPEPNNWTEIRKRLEHPRRSLAPSRFSKAELKNFRQTNRKAASEDKVMSAAFPIIAGTTDIPSQTNILFNNLQAWPVGNINTAKPDWYDGSNPSDLNQEIRRLLSRHIEPSTDTSRPLLPNYFTEGKGQSGSTHVCELQALRDGGLGARGIEAIRNYIDPQTVYDGNAYTITSTYHPTGLLTLYTMHAVEAKGQVYPAEFRMIQVRSFAMTDSPATFREGATWLRNARDLIRSTAISTSPQQTARYRLRRALVCPVLERYDLMNHPD
ncbi:MAG: hypothetical protein Q9196_004029 [Gyalolechia fulgens]